MTSSRLRELSRLASPAPWDWEWNFDGYPTELVAEGVGVIRPGIAVSPNDGTLAAFLTNDGDSAGRDHPDFALIVYLRNRAERIADMLDAVKAAVEQFDSVAGSPRDMDVGILSAHMDRLRAALAALGGEE